MADFNNFGKTSVIRFSTVFKDNKSILQDVYFTAPFKIMKPFYEKDGFMKVMLLSASAGIMKGDRQKFCIKIGSRTKTEFISQSYEKIHKMKDGFAERETTIFVDKNAFFVYNPLPTVPFKNSAFKNKTVIELADSSSKFILNEIMTCGRYKSGEVFQYEFYNSLIEIYQNCGLCLRDNIMYNPKIFNMSGIGMFEEYTHQGNLILCNFHIDEDILVKIRNAVNSAENIDGGLSFTESGFLYIKILGTNSQQLLEITDKIINFVK